MTLEAGMKLGRFEIREVVDRSADTSIYKAYDPKLKTIVAVETISPAVRDRFSREAKVLSKVKHPNICKIYETATVQGIPVIVAEFLNGTTLDEYVAKYHDNQRDFIDLIAQVADGLQAAHDKGVIHRDLKPSNIFVTNDRKAKILDLGIARITGKVPGKSSDTLGYKAPEQLLGKSLDPHADVYALGVICYESLTGRSLSREELIAVPKQSAALIPNVPAQVQAIVASMLEIEPMRRPAAGEVARTLHAATTPIIIDASQTSISAPDIEVETPRAAPEASRATIEQAPRVEAYRVQFGDTEAYTAALAAEATLLKRTVQSEKRSFISVEVRSAADEQQLRELEEHYGATIVEDYQYDMDWDVFGDAITPEGMPTSTLDDVLLRINTEEAWKTSRGNGITIAIVDTGVDGTRPEFPISKRVGAWQPIGETPWTDWSGHGTMCATIATATRSAGGTFDGVAPEANLIACKTRFRDSQLADVYDYLADLARGGMRIIASNSWGRSTGTPPSELANAQFPSALADAIDAGVIVVCSAGNYHDLTTGTANSCSPCSIWLHKSRADVLTVATCKLDGTMWFYSSRGPGQHHGQPNTNAKPDVTAPTPENGIILYGSNPRTLPDGWGTSGAAPQVAGLAALLLAASPGITRARLSDVIRETADSLACEANCCGAGIINCGAAVRKAGEETL